MNRYFFIRVLLLALLSSCVEYTPKPKGFPRFEPAPARYIQLPVDDVPYSFMVSDRITIELPEEERTGWINLVYEEFNVKVYCSYLPITPRSLPEVTAESARLVERMTSRATSSAYENPERAVYGRFYELEGDVAAPLQFYLTDSLTCYFRGALYYNEAANADSLAPVTGYLRKDIIELIETFNWKK